MIVLHAGLVGDEFWLWGESRPGGEAPKRAPARRRASRTSAAPPEYPYDAGPGRLTEAVDRSPGGFRCEPERIRRIASWLPARGGRPVASDPVVADPPGRRGRPALLAWAIHAIRLEAEETLTFLSSIPLADEPAAADASIPMLAAGIAAGRDLVFWTNALRWTAGLVTAQRFVPGVIVKEGAYFARWQPVIAGPDAVALAELAGTMPASARAIGPRDRDSPPATPPAAVLNAFVDSTLDHLVRSAQWPDGILPHVSGRASGRDFDSLHDHWLDALRSPDARLRSPRRDLEALARAVAEWRRPVTAVAAAPLRLAFRLEEPLATGAARGGTESGNGSEADRSADAQPSPDPADGAGAPGAWRLQFLLQAADDPSLQIPAAEAWRPSQGTASVFRRYGVHPGEHMLSGLGWAARVSPAIDSALAAAEPEAVELDTPAAHRFLREEAPALAAAGFALFLPAWWTGAGGPVRPRLRARADAPDFQSLAGLSLDALVDVRWDIIVGDEPLSSAELRALAELKTPLVCVKGRWVEVDAAGIAAALARPAIAGGRMAVRDVVRLALGAGGDGGEDPGAVAGTGPAAVEVAAGGWVARLLEALETGSPPDPPPPPPSLRAELRPYQRRGYAWLDFMRQWGFGACLADDMGLGKTVQTLAALLREREGNGRAPALVVCPTSVAGNWQREAERFAPGLSILVHHGPDRARGDAFRDAAGRHAVVVTTYALLHRDVEDLSAVSWGTVVLDEAQNIKNPDTKQARAARALRADARIALTGTPVENHVGDLWSLSQFLNPGLLGSRAEFKRRFFLPIQVARDAEAMTRLRRRTGPFILRRVKTDPAVIDDLPEKVETKCFCTLSREQASLYAAVLHDMEQALAGTNADGIERKGVILTTLTRLKQVCNHPANLLGDGSAIAGRSGKVERLIEMAGELLAVGDRALVFTQFAEMGGLLRDHVEDVFGREVVFLHGGVTRQKRDEMVRRFQEAEHGPPVMVLTLKAGGTGLNLTRASHVFHFDRWWNPAVEAQATDRAFRIGQRRNVQVHAFICAGTLEERIDSLLESKRDIAARVVGAGEGWITELSDDELRDMLALRDHAVED